MKKYKIKQITINKNHPSIKLSSNNNYLFLCFSLAGYYEHHHTRNLFAYNDFILLKPNQSIKLTAFQKESELNITCVNIPINTLIEYSDENTNLKNSFEFVPFDIALIQAKNDRSSLIKNILHFLAKENEESLIGSSILDNGLFSTFLILFLRECISNDYIHKVNNQKRFVIDDIFNYISNHLNEDLSLKKLSSVFYLSEEHISREFKNKANISIHKYIVKSRIDLAKTYLNKGYSITEVARLSGFNSYNHFFKVFKKECHMTPLNYYHLYDKKEDSTY